MKVLIINSVCGTGSTGRIVSDLWKNLKMRGHSVKVAFGLGSGKVVDKEDQICYNNKVGYYLHNIAAKITDKTGLYSARQTKHLISEIKKFDPDVIHLHQLHGYHINYRMLFEYLAQANKKVVWTLHDCWAFTGHCAHFTYNKCEQWKTGCASCEYIKEYPACWFKGKAAENYTIKKEAFTSVKNMTIVTPSQWLADIVKESFFCKYPIKVINNGIDLSVFHPRESNFREIYNLQGKKIILAVSNVWNEKKGLYDVLKLADMLDETYQVVIVGVTEKQKKSLPSNILGITRTENAEKLAEIYTTADVFVNLTYEDTYPTVNLESLACGTPVFTYLTGGSPESIIDQWCGKIINQKDIFEVKNCILNIEKYNVNMPKEFIDKENSSKKYIELYKER